eukprot:12415938-Karenia_brevis.AAC.1
MPWNHLMHHILCNHLTQLHDPRVWMPVPPLDSPLLGSQTRVWMLVPPLARKLFLLVADSLAR